MTVKPRSIFPITPRRSASERRFCKGCGKMLIPTVRSSDFNLCRECFSKLPKKETVYYPVERPIIKVRTKIVEKVETVRVLYDSHPEQTRELKQSRDRAVDLAVNNNQRATRLEELLAQRDTVVDRLTHENKRLKKHHGQS